MRLALVFLTISAVSAQMPTPLGLARPLLQSANPRDKIWGAWLAGASRDPAFRVPLIEQLKRTRATEQPALIAALLDALIQLGAPVPVDAVLPFADLRRTEVLILMSRSPIDATAESGLLDIREQSLPDAERALINDLLFASSSKKFFQRTLEELAVTHHFLVLDGNGGFGKGYGCGGCGSIIANEPPKDLPLIAPYSLTMAPKPGDVLLIVQPVPVYYTRAPGACFAFPASDRQALTARFFSAIVGLPAERSETIFHPTTQVETAAQIPDVLTTQALTIRSLITDAQKRGLFDASGMHLPIAVTIEDHRIDRTEPLPAILPYDIAIP
jgi:hypothetical protein